MNKETERFYLDEFKKNYPHFPDGSICPDERPDFLIKCRDEVIGIEVTKIFRDMAGTSQSPLQQREAVRNKIMQKAKEVADQRGLLNAYVFVHFDLNFCCKNSEIADMASKLVLIAEQKFQRSDSLEFIRPHEIEIAGIAGLSIQKTKGSSFWKNPLASFVPTIRSQQLQTILDEKSALTGDYRKKCNKVWLVIVMDRFIASSYSLIPDEIDKIYYKHNFDSAFLFCYTRYDEQKPPYLLQNLSDAVS